MPGRRWRSSQDYPQNRRQTSRLFLASASITSSSLSAVSATPSTRPTSCHDAPDAAAARIASPSAFSTAMEARQHSRTASSGSCCHRPRCRRRSRSPCPVRRIRGTCVSTSHSPCMRMNPRQPKPDRMCGTIVEPVRLPSRDSSSPHSGGPGRRRVLAHGVVNHTARPAGPWDQSAECRHDWPHPLPPRWRTSGGVSPRWLSDSWQLTGSHGFRAT